MKNKINIDVFIPTLNETFNLFIPVNKSVGEVIKLINSAINDLTNKEYPLMNNLSFTNVQKSKKRTIKILFFLIIYCILII